jgi:hypothetical protein
LGDRAQRGNRDGCAIGGGLFHAVVGYRRGEEEALGGTYKSAAGIVAVLVAAVVFVLVRRTLSGRFKRRRAQECHAGGRTANPGGRAVDRTYMGLLDISPGGLAVSIFISLVGAALLMYGRKELRVPHVVTGLILIVFPYFVGSWWLAIVVAVVVIAVLALVTRLGF